MSVVLMVLIFWGGKVEMTTQSFRTAAACERARQWVAQQHEASAAVIRSTCTPDPEAPR